MFASDVHSAKPEELRSFTGNEQRLPYNILVVDDESLVRWSLYQIFKKVGYNVVTAASAEEAMEQLVDTHFDLIVTDLKLPGENGFHLAEQVKKRFSHCPVFLISAFGDEVSRKKAKEIGVEYFFDKPVDMGKLLWAATKVLRQSGMIHLNSDDEK